MLVIPDLLQMIASAIRELALLVGYIKNNSFPQPLDSAEEEKCIRAMVNGDNSARQKLIEHNLRLVAHVGKKYDNTRIDNDDLISIGTVGLIKAINTFDPSKGVRLGTYAARCIENEILMQLRSMKKSRDDLSLEEPLGVDQEGNELSLLDILGADSDLFEQVETIIQVKLLKETIARLPRRERFVLERRFGLKDGRAWPQREVAERLGISRSYVSRIEKKALRMLNYHLKRGN
jgi:RNA polymerase sporulation-specific sigma factor